MYWINKLTGIPFEANHNRPDADQIKKQTYDEKVKQWNDKAEADRLATEEATRPVREYEKKIQDKLREMAIKELEKK